MDNKNMNGKNYKTWSANGRTYYRTRIKDADGKLVTLYADTPEELYDKEMEAREQIRDAIFRKNHPTVEEYCETWLQMQSAKITAGTIKDYKSKIRNYIVKPLGEMYLEDVTADDIKIALISASKKSSSVYNTVNMLYKCIFSSACISHVIDYDPSVGISPKGGSAKKEREALTDEQVKLLLDTIRDLPPYTFVMIGLFAGLRREEILGLKWDCVFLDASTPYISVQRAWRAVNNRPEITDILKTPSSRRNVPIPQRLTDHLREAKAKSISEFVIADRNGQPLAYSQFVRVWKYIRVRSTKERSYYRYINGQSIKYNLKPVLGQKATHNPEVVYCLDFDVTPHQLRHTYITNLIHASVDPKTVQYLAGHKNSKVTMDIYAKVKYNKPQELAGVVNKAFGAVNQVDKK